jgi:hypothetical protein
LSAGNNRNGTPTSGYGGHPAASDNGHYAGRRAPVRRRTARWAGKAVPAATIAAAFAAGAAAYGFTGTSHGPAGPGKVADALSAALRTSNVAQVGAGEADNAAATVIVSGRTATIRPAASHASASPSARPAAARATAHPAAAASTRSARAANAAVTPAVSPSAAATPRATLTAAFSCSANGGMLPQNVTAIVNFLVDNGYSHNAAAGIAGNMYQESKGDPEAVGMGGGGLIGFTPLPAGYVTGNPATDLQTQLQAVLKYNQIWASYLPALNAAATPAAAAAIYVTDFERAGIPAASTREASAQAVASACGL